MPPNVGRDSSAHCFIAMGGKVCSRQKQSNGEWFFSQLLMNDIQYLICLVCALQEQKYTMPRPTDADLLGPGAGITPGSSGARSMLHLQHKIVDKLWLHQSSFQASSQSAKIARIPA